MDTMALERTTPAKAGSRRRRTVEEKRRIVEETLAPGASLALIARRHEVNANLLFSWRRALSPRTAPGELGGPGDAGGGVGGISERLTLNSIWPTQVGISTFGWND